MNAFAPLSRFTIVACVAAATATPAAAASLIVNGGFEAGLTGWTRADQLGSDGTFFVQSGTTSPVSGFTVPAPPQGTQAAMTDSQGPGSHVLYQSIAIAAPVPTATLSFDLFIGNRATDPFGAPFPFQTPSTLDFATALLNQQARVDILAAGADPFSVALADVLLNVFQTLAADPPVSGYTHFSFDVTGLVNANVGGSLLLRFAEVDNVGPFQFGVDNVSLETGPAQTVDEPSTAALLATLAAALLVGVRRRHVTN
jgi:MYXO-CTERM domain-containing protein